MMTPRSRRYVIGACAVAMWSGVLSGAAGRAQSGGLTTSPAAAAPEFDVSVVKLGKGGSSLSSGIYTGHGRLDAENVTLKRCIMGAYGVGPHQIIGGPGWVQTEAFDIQAKTDQPIDDDAVLNEMLQRLLADRFKLVLHRETRTISALVLETGKSGPKLKKAEGGESSTNTWTDKNGVSIEAKNTDMDLFAQVLAREMDLPVVNETELKGLFDFKLHWTPENLRPSDDSGKDEVSIFTALEEQLGLRLHSAKAPVEVLVIEQVEKPSEN